MNNKDLIYRSLVSLLILVNIGWSNGVLAQNGWERMADMNIERIYHGSCEFENRIFVFGGTVRIQYNLSEVEVYFISTNKWNAIANMPRNIGKPDVCEINNMIYIIGGIYDVDPRLGSYASDLNYVYNPEKDGYFKKRSCPFPTWSSPYCKLNNKIYVFGNRKTRFDPWKPQKKVFVYDPAVDSWDTLPDMNFEHIDGDAMSLHNKAYLLGGAIEEFPNFFIEGKSEMFDPENNSWTVLKDMPFPVAGHASVVYNNKILVFGGDSTDYSWGTFGISASTSTGTNLIQEYDPSTDTWRVIEGMPFNRFGSKAHKVGDFIYLIGGEDMPNHRIKEVWRLDPSYLEPITTYGQLDINRTTFALHQNYPNPFSGSTQISYELKELGKVKLDLINFLGQEISTLAHETKRPGSYSVTLDTKGLDTGIYFYRLRVGGSEKVRKLIVLQ